MLSHRDAVALHGLRPPGDHRDVEVTTTRRAGSVERIRIHRTTCLDAEDVTSRHGIPVTSVARTLVDFAGLVTAEQLAKALSEAERLGLFDLVALERAMACMARRRGRGHAALCVALADLRAAGIQLTRSELEDRFLSLVVRHGLPRPAMNATVVGMEVDVLWRRERFAVELDGYAFHHTTQAFQRDRDRANDLARAGYTVLRFTYDDVVRRPERVAARVAEMLRYAPAP